MSFMRLILLGGSAVLVLLGLSLAPDVYWLLPRTIQHYPEQWAFGATLAGYLAALGWSVRGGPWSPSSRRLARGLERLDEVSAAALQRWIFIGLAATAGHGRASMPSAR